jgi:cysteinyl-tRNA synthetase
MTDDQIDALVVERTLSRIAGDFAHADAIRKQLIEADITIWDTRYGTFWFKGNGPSHGPFK